MNIAKGFVLSWVQSGSKSISFTGIELKLGVLAAETVPQHTNLFKHKMLLV